MKRTPTTREARARAIFRASGFRVESVPMIRSRDDEFMAIECWPAENAARIVQLITDPRNATVEVQRIHIGRVTYPGQSPVVRVYVKFAEQS